MPNGGLTLMPDWQDSGLILGARRHGENAVIVSAFTPTYGRHLGLIHSKRLPLAGSIAELKWHARLPEHLGNYKLEITDPLSARYLSDHKRLACLSSLCALLDEALPEREPMPEFYQAVCYFLSDLDSENWLMQYIRLELLLLTDLGFGLDLTKCAGGGDANNLAYVSPKTGRAVSREKGDPYREKLLPLPRFLWQATDSASPQELGQGLHLVGYFLSRHVKELPLTRIQLL